MCDRAHREPCTGDVQQGSGVRIVGYSAGATGVFPKCREDMAGALLTFGRSWEPNLSLSRSALPLSGSSRHGSQAIGELM